ncbi:hypothetical protein CEXT_814391 [Caerostris extrusa]|uniref:Uncharacterized protein n=1 Tax=Caerostris extrusa TaxID=172846 RepID=A0AAV4Y3Q1_CAEEX|nr:hypothetical protein CEXT_814391 [Caerostris extrusa]
MSSIEDGKRWLGRASFTVLSVMFLMSWFELNVFDVTGVVLLIGFVGKKLALPEDRNASRRLFGLCIVVCRINCQKN